MSTDKPADRPDRASHATAVDLESFALRVRRSRERARDLAGQLARSPPSDVPAPLHVVKDEWLATVEQLQIAEEELRQQNEQLEATSEEAQTNHARYQELFELAPDAYLVTDAAGVVREANRAAAALFRISRGYLGGKPLAVFVDPEERRAFRDCVQGVAAKDRVEQTEIRLRPRYGPPVYVSVSATASRDASGAVAAIRWILRDVTEQRRAAERLRAINVTVERRVGERTAQLEQLILERDARIAVVESELAVERVERLAAEALSARRFDLLGMLSHEIRTPLHASQGYLELLEMSSGGTLTPEQRGYLARMHGAQDYLLGILQGVLALARLERGAADLDLEDVPVDSVLATIPPLVQPHVLEKQLTCEHHLGDPSVTVFADRARLQQIVLNLVGNAVKFTPPGGVVSMSWEAGAGDVAIHVRDTGRGLREADLERIFEPFVQAGTPASDGPRGVGLGLAISRQLARLMGGELTVVSALGEGSTFTLRLPGSAGRQQGQSSTREESDGDT